MGRVIPLFDKLVNAFTGTGTGRDARSANLYTSRPLTQPEIAAAYSGSGLMRKIVQIPALDMVREWRDWTGLEDDEASAVYDEEKRLALRQKVRQVEVLRGMGGGALILGLPGNPSKPAPATIGKGGLAFVHVVSRWHLTFDALADDATAGGFGEPAMWQMTTTRGQQPIHPSRVVPFRADTAASLAMPAQWSAADAFWGESTVQQVLDAVQDSDGARAAFAALIHKARLLRLGIPGLMDLVSTTEGETLVQNRLAAVVLAESIHNATIYDAGNEEGKGGETITDATYNFAGAKDVLNAYAEFVAAISDIPATRLLGRAPEGLNSSGDSQQEDWRKRVRAMQTLDLAPCLDRVDRYLLQSATGTVPKDAANDWAPLDTPGQKERAETFFQFTQALEKLQATAAIPDQAFARGVQSYIIEEGFLPELEAALGEMSDEERYGLAPELEAEGGDPESGGGDPNDPATLPAADAAPRTLYVSRPLLNAADVIKWAKAQGFETTLPADEMHVTVLFSRQAVDWMKMGSPWNDDPKGNLTITAGGARLVEPLGDQGAIVLLFNSSSLSWRHEDMVRNGASHDFDEYQPHVTITYAKPGGLDLAKIEPYRGELRFGPERFAEIDDDWSSNITEDGGSRISGRPFADAKRRRSRNRGGGIGHPSHFDPNQPRGAHGRWIETGASAEGATLKSFAAQAMAKPQMNRDHSLGKITGNGPAHVIGFTRVVNSQEVRKNLNKHGNPNNLVAGQPAITNADFNAIPDIVKNGTFRVIGFVGARKPQRIEYRATVDGKAFVYTETVGVDRKRVALLSFYRLKDGPGG